MRMLLFINVFLLIFNVIIVKCENVKTEGQERNGRLIGLLGLLSGIISFSVELSHIFEYFQNLNLQIVMKMRMIHDRKIESKIREHLKIGCRV